MPTGSRLQATADEHVLVVSRVHRFRDEVGLVLVLVADDRRRIRAINIDAVAGRRRRAAGLAVGHRRCTSGVLDRVGRRGVRSGHPRRLTAFEVVYSLAKVFVLPQKI